MITEKRFVLSHQSFWHDLAPMMPTYVRRRNLSPERYITPLAGGNVQHRGLVNEAALRVFALSIGTSTVVRGLSNTAVEECIDAATKFVNRFRVHDRVELRSPGSTAVPETREIAERLERFFGKHPDTVAPWPSLPGCGWLDAAEGDLASEKCLYEVKASEGPFKGQDLRQTLCYAALAHAAGRAVWPIICLVNPRRGVFLRDSLDHLCREIAGVAAPAVLDAMITYVSEPQWEQRA